jgi:hypothetical protein
VSLTERLRAQREALKADQQRATERARLRSEMRTEIDAAGGGAANVTLASAIEAPKAPTALVPSASTTETRLALREHDADSDDEEGGNDDRGRAHTEDRGRSDVRDAVRTRVSRGLAEAQTLPTGTQPLSAPVDAPAIDGGLPGGDEWQRTESRETYVVDADDADSVLQRTAGATTRGSRGSRGQSTVTPLAAAIVEEEHDDDDDDNNNNDDEEDEEDDHGAAVRRRTTDRPTSRGAAVAAITRAPSPPRRSKQQTSSEGRISRPSRSTAGDAAATSTSAPRSGTSASRKQARPASPPPADASDPRPAGGDASVGDVEAALRSVVHEALSSEDVQSKIRECTMRVIREGKLAGLEHEDQVCAPARPPAPLRVWHTCVSVLVCVCVCVCV